MFKVGDRVRINDSSEAHGDLGVVCSIQNGIISVLLDSGCVWPVLRELDLKKSQAKLK